MFKKFFESLSRILNTPIGVPKARPSESETPKNATNEIFWQNSLRIFKESIEIILTSKNTQTIESRFNDLDAAYKRMCNYSYEIPGWNNIKNDYKKMMEYRDQNFRGFKLCDFQSVMSQYKSSPSPKFHKSDIDIDMGTDFYIKKCDIIDEYEAKMIIDRSALKDLSIDEQIKLHKQSIEAYEKLKKFCYKTKSGAMYFQEMWEHCSNSSTPDFCFIDPIKENYNFLNLHYDTLANLESIIIETIKSNPGLIQKSIYKLIDVDLKHHIQVKIRELETANKIKRTKKSGSYLLELSDASSSEEDIKEADKDITEPLPAIVKSNHIDINKTSTMVLKEGLNIPDEIINLLWIKGGPLNNYTPDKFEECDDTLGLSIKIYSIEPSLIDISLPIDTDIKPSDFIEDIGYYPSYENLTPKQRYVYLSWLQDISKPIAMGYVFIFYYGLERHLLFGKYKEALKIIQYLQQFHENNSFYTYSTDAMLISVLKHRDLNYMKTINWDNANTKLIALMKGVLQGGYNTSDIIKLHKDFEFKNGRYIKNQYESFYNAVQNILVSKFGSDFYPIPSNAIKNSTENQLLVVANYSLMYNNRLATIPDITTNIELRNGIYDILSEAHETVKLNNKSKRKNNATNG